MSKRKLDQKPWYIKWWAMLLIIMFWIVLFKVIDVLYLAGKQVALPNTTLTSSDLLIYAGSCFAALVSIYGIHVAEYNSKKRQDDSIRNAALPCISTNLQLESLSIIKPNKDPNKLRPLDTIFGTPVIKDEGYINADKRYLFVISNKIEIVESLNGEQQKKLGTFFMNSKGVIQHSTQLILIRLVNVGKEAAVNFYPAIVKHGASEESRVIPTVFPRKAVFFVAIYFERGGNENGDYDFQLYYDDIYGNKYKQTQKLTVERDGVIMDVKSTCVLIS